MPKRRQKRRRSEDGEAEQPRSKQVKDKSGDGTPSHPPQTRYQIPLKTRHLNTDALIAFSSMSPWIHSLGPRKTCHLDQKRQTHTNVTCV